MSSNLDTCFRGEAARWWNNEVDELVRGGLLHTRDINNWCRVLEERFKLPPSQAMDRLDNIRYTIRDAANRRSVTAYVSSIVAAAKQCGETTEFQQVLRAWRHLDLALRAAIDEPKEGTTVKTFMDTLLAKQSNLFDIARRLNRRNDVHDVYTSDRKQPPYGRITGQWRDGNFPRRYQRNDRYLSPFVANSYDYQFNPAIQTNRNPQSLQRNPTYGQDQPYDQKPQSSSQDPNTNRRTPPAHQPLPLPPQRPMISDKPFNRAEPDPRTRWRQQGPPQIPQRRATAYSGAQYDDEQEFYGAQGYNLDDGHSDDLPDGDYLLEGSYANYSDSPTNSKAVNETQLEVQSADGANELSEAYTCLHCDDSFSSNNKLHKHLRTSHTNPLDSNVYHATALVPRVMESTISDNTEPGHGFRGWHYAAAQGSLAESGTPEEICLDSGCSSTLIDKAFLQRHLPKVETYTRDNCPLTVRGIGDRKHVINQYVHIHVFIRGIFQNQIVLLKFPIEANITEDLRANMLIGTDVLGPHQILLDIFNAKAIARTCQNAAIPLRIRAKPHHTTPRPVYNKQRVVIPPFSQARLPIRVNKQVPEDRDSTFTPEYKHVTLYNHVVDANFSFVHAINLLDKPVVIPRKVRLGTISDLDEVSAYMAHEDAAELARVDQTNVLRIKPARAIGEAKPQDIQTKLPNGVTVYGNDTVAVKLAEVVNRYSEVWENPGGFANVPENEWMRVPLIDDWQTKIKAMRLGRVYSLGPVEKQLVDEMFDKLHQQGRMQWASNHSPRGYPVFVAWRTQYKDGNAVKKGRVVVDIRNLNKITVPDIYPTPSQSDILAALANKRYISVVDAVSFFYQWRIHPDDRNRLTVVSHRGQETFNVAIMGYMNSAAYVQRQLDNKLRDLHEFVRAYIDDIIIFSDTLDDHLDHLDRLFSRLKELNIHLAPTKAYIGFPSVVMLGIRVDSLGLTTPEEKLKAISNLKFPYTLKQLETYLGFTGWMRQYVPRYAQVSEPLQQRKLIMSQTDPNAGKARKQFARIARNTSPSPAEYEAYSNIQCAFKNPTMLIHADKT